MEYNWEISPFGIPPTAGVYAVCSRVITNNGGRGSEHVLYIGSSKNMRRRVSSNVHPYRITYNRFPTYVKFIETDEYEKLEIQCINKFKPILNTHYK